MEPITGIPPITMWTMMPLVVISSIALSLGCSSHDQMPPGAVRPTSIAQVQKVTSSSKIPPQYMAEVMKQEQAMANQGARSATSMPKPGGALGGPGVAPPGTAAHKAP